MSADGIEESINGLTRCKREHFAASEGVVMCSEVFIIDISHDACTYVQPVSSAEIGINSDWLVGCNAFEA
jgi:hypothetical protein